MACSGRCEPLIPALGRKKDIEVAPNKVPIQPEEAIRTVKGGTLDLAVEGESTVYTGMCPRNGSSPMWCYGNTCIVRIGEEVFVSGQEKLDQFEPLNDCRWTLFKKNGQRLGAPAGGRAEPNP